MRVGVGWKLFRKQISGGEGGAVIWDQREKLLSLKIEFYGWKVDGDYNVVPKWFIGYHHLWQIVVKSIKKDITKTRPKESK